MASMASSRVLPLTEPPLISLVQPLYHGMLSLSVSHRAPIGQCRQIRKGYELGRFLQHVVTMPAGDGYKRDSLGVVADFFDERRSLLHNFVEAILTPLE